MSGVGILVIMSFHRQSMAADIIIQVHMKLLADA